MRRDARPFSAQPLAEPAFKIVHSPGLVHRESNGVSGMPPRSSALQEREQADRAEIAGQLAAPVAVRSAPKDWTKRVSTRHPRAALRGVCLVAIDDDRGWRAYIATLHEMTKSMAGLEEVEQWLDMVHGKHEEAPAS